ncbi:nucleoside-diphosphate kinase [Rubellicoccus peritrichatus]|uniref:Nucleoside diphosphate kinase n=1 Tax=Rubellicoccus peritrichatus TaxID=3080537 RepID=A0AAQ3QW37_9BACT|nr:nucleoside-diphosphate kinase [Puniceicoccus sp. CR14]WOO42243.1 nucleoside-diphosphate kinase [Puniceicoccus sp. CR14]
MEKTLVILKPDCMEKGLYGEVLGRFARIGMEIVGCKMMHLGSEILREHYAHVADKPFFPEIEGFMSSRPVIVLILKGDGVIDRVRALLGPTNSKEAPAGTIRGDIGTNMMINICHASDGPDTAAAEIERFFKAEEVFG